MKIIRLSLFIVCTTSLVKAQQLQEYISEAQANNPNIRAYELRYNMAEEKVNEAVWLPNTEFGAGYFVSEPETRTGAQRARFSARQMLPWFGTLSSRQEYATAMAETEYIDYLIARRKLALEVAQSYYQLSALQSLRKVLDQNIQLLKTYEELALTSVEVGQASAVDVLRLQIRQNELQQQQDILRENFAAEQSAFNGLLNRDDGTAIALPPEMHIPDQDPVLEAALELNPELLRFDRMYNATIQSELLNQKESAPMLGFGLDYIPVQERPDLDFSDNGKDILMPMVSLSIPVFNKQYASRTRQNELRKQEIAFQKQERQNILETALAKAVSLRNEARIANRTQIRNLVKAKDAENILLKNYETGTIDFKDVIDIQEIQLKFQINQIQAVQKYYVQSAIINYLIKT